MTGVQTCALPISVNKRFSLVTNASGTYSRFGLGMDLPDGPLLWKSSTARTVIGTPYIYGGSVFASDQSTLVSCHDIMSGMLVWEAGEAVAATCPIEVNYAHHLVLTGGKNGVMHAESIDDGQEAWQRYAADRPGGPGVVDQLSFLVMRRYGLTQAFTNDQHFRTAGFEPLF